MKSPGYKLWTAISIFLLVVCCLLLIGLSEDVRLISLLVLPPLVAGLTTTPRRTSLVTALTIAAAVALGLGHSATFLSTSHTLRLAVVIVTSALAVQTAILRERDLRTRRRLVLINAARDQLDAASGIEEALSSFCRAAVAAEFVEWAILDVRVPDGSQIRIVESSESAERLDVAVRPEPTGASTAYESEVERGGPLLTRKADPALLEGLFEGAEITNRSHVNLIIKQVTVGDLRAVYYLVCPDPYPPWGEAELTQVASLARAAAQKARSDQLIDRITHAQDELRESRDEVGAIVGGIASGIIAQRPSGEIVYANDVAARMLDWENAEAMIGSNFSEVIDRVELRHEDGSPFAQEDIPSRRALRGDKNPTALFRYIVKSSGSEFWMFVRSTAIFDAAGEPSLAIAVIEDNTERKRSELAQSFLASASKELGMSLDFDSAVAAVAHAVVPAIADWCTIEMIADNGSIETVAVAHSDPDQAESVRKFRSDYPISDSDDYGPARAIRHGEAALYDRVDLDRFREIYGDEERAQAVTKLAPRSSLSAPITVRGEPIGSISLALTRPGARFTEYDLQTVVELGLRAGIALDNARLHTERMRMLSSLQQSLIPAKLPDLDGVQLSATFRPAQRAAEVGGDFYDAFELPDGSSALVIGDVCGKGPEAAALTALARYTIRAEAMTESDPAVILRNLNAALIEQMTDGRFCTVAFARLTRTPGGHSLETISAGHPLPLVIGGDNEPLSVGASGTLLGVVPDPKLPVGRHELRHGESLMLYTDGLSAGQTTDDTAYALALVTGLSLNGASSAASTIDAAAVASQTVPNRDDVAILVARSE
jgi:PAS domain S-box-containing protein